MKQQGRRLPRIGAVLPGVFLLNKLLVLVPDAMLTGSLGMLNVVDGLAPSDGRGYLIGGNDADLEGVIGRDAEVRAGSYRFAAVGGGSVVLWRFNMNREEHRVITVAQSRLSAEMIQTAEICRGWCGVAKYLEVIAEESK